MKMKKSFLLKIFRRRKSSRVKIVCSDTHLKFFFFVDILQVCYNKIVVI